MPARHRPSLTLSDDARKQAIGSIKQYFQAELDQEVRKILGELGVADRPVIHVLNKVDRISPEQRESFEGNLNGDPGSSAAPATR